jgi:hypothetical protein
MLDYEVGASEVLRYLRQPQHEIERVTETCDLAGEEYTRSVEFLLAKHASGPENDEKEAERQRFALLTASPRGAMQGYTLRDDDWRFLTHSEHNRLAQYLIIQSIFELADTVKGPDAREAANRISLAAWSLIEIPVSNPSDAKAIAQEQFRHDGPSHALRKLDGLDAQVDTHAVQLLFKLCETLVENYLVVAVHEGPDAKHRRRLGFSYTEVLRYEKPPARLSPEGLPLAAPIRQLVSWRWVRELLWTQIYARVQRTYSIPPASWQIPAPMASYTDHYSLTINAPTDFFFTDHRVYFTTVDPATAQRVEHRDRVPDGVGMARECPAGRRAEVFVENGRDLGNSGGVQVWHRLSEKPGRSVFKGMLLAGFLTIAQGLLLILLLFFPLVIDNNVPVLLLTAVPLIAAALDRGISSHDPTMMPVSSRSAPYLLTLNALIFAIVYACMRSIYPPPPVSPSLPPLDNLSFDLLAVVLIASIASSWLIFAYLRGRHGEIIANRMAALGSPGIAQSNLAPTE